MDIFHYPRSSENLKNDKGVYEEPNVWVKYDREF